MAKVALPEGGIPWFLHTWSLTTLQMTTNPLKQGAYHKEQLFWGSTLANTISTKSRIALKKGH